MDRSDQPGLHKLLNEVPTKTGIVYVNGQLQSVQPPGTNPPMMLAAGGPEVRPGESATYSSAADHVHYAGGCPHCGLTRGLDGNLYDAKGIITTNITTGCIPCGCDDDYAITACNQQLAMTNPVAAETPCAGCNKAKATKKNAQLPEKPCNCAKKALMKTKPIDRKSIMM